MTAPIIFLWTGESMVPVTHYVKECDRRFVVGQRYRMDVLEERSAASHNFYFAALHEAWNNLPEELLARYPSQEHLRKYALIHEGYADERSIVCQSKAEAQRVASFVKPMDDFAVVVVSEATVKVFTAQSQSQRAMGKEQFEKSKAEVLGFVSSLIGIDKAKLEANAGKSA